MIEKLLQYVYEMIEKDLLEGLPLIEDKAYTVPKYHFNKCRCQCICNKILFV